MQRIFILIILMALLIQCKPQNGQGQIKSINQRYLMAKSFFKPQFTDHFPDSLASLPAGYTVDTNAITDHPRFILYRYKINNEVDSLLNKYSQKSIAKYSAIDTCLLIVNRFTTKENRNFDNKKIDETKISKSCYDHLLPVPCFWDASFSDTTTETKLPSDFELFVLEAKAGKFWDDSHITDGRYLPPNWKNGYSKGVAISKKRNIIIYWFIIW